MPRIEIAGLPHHVIVRGNNRQPCFSGDRDRRVFMKYLREALVPGGCDLHAFALMTNHVHLLLTSRKRGELSRVMHSVGTRYSRYFNVSHGRTGTLFEGRFRSIPIEGERYLLACMRYIELNPVRAGLVASPEQYRWASCRHNIGQEVLSEVTPHEEYLRISPSREARCAAYAALLREGIPEDELSTLRVHISRGRALGSNSPQDGVRATRDFGDRLRNPSPEPVPRT